MFLTDVYKQLLSESSDLSYFLYLFEALPPAFPFKAIHFRGDSNARVGGIQRRPGPIRQQRLLLGQPDLTFVQLSTDRHQKGQRIKEF